MLKNSFISFAIIIGIINSVSAQFSQSLHGNTNTVINIETDQNNNTYLVGFLGARSTKTDSINFGTSGKPKIIIPNGDNRNHPMYFASYDSKGRLRFAHQFEIYNVHTRENFPNIKLKVDRRGNSYILGDFIGDSILFDFKKGQYTKSKKRFSQFLVSYDKDFNFRFLITDTNAMSNIFNIALDWENNIILLGSFEGSIDLDFSESNYFLHTKNSGYFLAKYNEFGRFVSAKTLIEDTSSKKLNANIYEKKDFTIGMDKHYYIAGWSTIHSDFDPSVNVKKLVPENFKSWYFYISSYDKDGKLRFAHLVSDSIEANGGGANFQIKVNKDNQIFIVSHHKSGLKLLSRNKKPHSLNPKKNRNRPSIFLFSYDKNLDLLYSTDITKSLQEPNTSEAEISSVEIDSNSNVFMAGKYSGYVYYDTTIGRVKEGKSPILFLSYTSGGLQRFLNGFGALNNNSHGNGKVISIGENGLVVLAGTFIGDSLCFTKKCSKNILSSSKQNTFITTFSNLGTHLLDSLSNPLQINSTNKDEILVYPNPASQKIYIKSKLLNKFQVELINNFGQILYQNNNNLSIQTIDSHNIKPGLYIIAIKNNQMTIFKKIIIHH